MATADVVPAPSVTPGAFIARRLLAAGHQVRTLTNNPGFSPAGPQREVASAPLDFDDADSLMRSSGS